VKRPKAKAAAAGRPSVHASIDVPELEAGLRFYGEVFGFVETARPFPTMAVLDANNLSVCMHEKVSGSNSSSRGSELRRYERHWTPVHLDLHVEDFDAVLDEVRARGGAIENEFRTQGPMPTAFCSDPFGNGFCVIGERTD
jgi:predicted enzyme related to lactoylglutathione lyase